MLQDAFLHEFHSVVVGIQNLLRILDGHLAAVVTQPRQTQQGLDIFILHTVLRTLSSHVVQFVDFLLDSFLHQQRTEILVETSTELRYFIVCALSQFVLDVFHLLAQEILALLLVQFALRLHLDTCLQLGKLFLALQQFQQFDGTLAQVVLHEQAHVLLVRYRHTGTKEIDVEHTVLNVSGRELCINLHAVALLQHPVCHLLAGIHRHSESPVVGARSFLRILRHLSHHVSVRGMRFK